MELTPPPQSGIKEAEEVTVNERNNWNSTGIGGVQFGTELPTTPCSKKAVWVSAHVCHNEAHQALQEAEHTQSLRPPGAFQQGHGLHRKDD